MANEVSVFAQSFMADLALLEKQAERETLVGLRGVGKVLVRNEKSKAPVYSGPRGARRLAKGKLGPQQSGPVVGLLRFSVKSGRARKGLEGYRIVVGPGGGRVNLYKGKIERKYRFAQQAYDEVVPFASVIMAAAWSRALRRAA